MHESLEVSPTKSSKIILDENSSKIILNVDSSKNHSFIVIVLSNQTYGVDLSFTFSRSLSDEDEDDEDSLNVFVLFSSSFISYIISLNF